MLATPERIVVCLFVFWLLVMLLVTSPLLLSLRDRRGRSRPRGGYTAHSPRVSGSGSRGTARAVRTSTACKPAGRLPVAPDGLALRAALSRTTAPTDSGSDTAISRGDRTTGAAGLAAAAEPVRCYPHVIDPRSPRRCARCGAALVVF